MVRKEIVIKLTFNEQSTSLKDIERALDELVKIGVNVEVINYSKFAESVRQLLSTMAPYAFEAS